MIIGRSDPHRNHWPHIDLGAIDIKNSVSRLYAEIRLDSAGFLIEDKGSLNGTKINGKMSATKRTSAVTIPGSMRLW